MMTLFCLVRNLLKHNTNTETRGIADWNALEWAMYRDHVKVALLLMEYGADVKAQERDENTPLYWALDWGKVAAARALIRYGADVEALCKDSQTLLHRVKGEKAGRLLLKHGADANALDIKNRTPLHLASEKGRVEVGCVLLEHGVDVNARSAGQCNSATSGSKFHVAAHAEISLLLLQYGSDIHARDDDRSQIPSPFMRATAKNAHEGICIMQLLLELGAEDHRR